MDTWRLIDSGFKDAAYTAAADEAMLIARNERSAPSTLHLYRRDAPAVSLGYFQKVRECVDLTVAREKGVSIVRRMSGGSAIYTDKGQLIYSLIADEDELPGTAEDVFDKICGVLIDALSSFGIEAEHHRPNDVLVGGRKISGSAQARRGRCVAQHGTILVDADLALMNRVLPSAKRAIDGMTTMALELGYSPSMDSVAKALVDSFQRGFDVRIVEGRLSDVEERLTARLIETKHSAEEYIFMR